MSRRIKILLLIGMLLGAGFASALRVTESQLERLILRELNKIAQEACADCVLSADSLSLSLLRQSATARNIRLTDDGATAMHFKTLKLTAGLKDIFSRVLYLNRLTFSDGGANGIGPDSAAFAFIERISKKPPPEKKRPLIKIKLEKLYIRKAYITEDIAEQRLEATDVNLDIVRQRQDGQRDFFLLTPEVGNLRVNFLQSESSVKIGSLSGLVSLLQDYTAYENLKLKNAYSKTIISGRAKKPGGNLSAVGQTEINLEKLFPTAKGQLQGDLSISGNYNKPEISADLNSADPLLFQAAGLKLAPIRLELLRLIYRDQTLTIPEVRIGAAPVMPRVKQPVRITADGLSGSMNLTAEDLVLSDSVSLNGLDIDLRFSGTPAQPEVSVSGSSSRIIAAGFSTEKIRLSGTLDQQNSQLRLTDQAGQSSIDIGYTQQSQELLADLKLEEFNLRNPQGIGLSLNTKGQLKLKDKQVRKNSLPLEIAILVPQKIAEPQKIKLTGLVNLNAEAVDIALDDRKTRQQIQVSLTLPASGDAPAALVLRLNDLSLSRFNPRLKCARITAGSKVNLQDFTGEIRLANFVLGCNDYQLELTRPQVLRLDQSGVVEISQLQLINPSTQSELTVDGVLRAREGFDLRISGGLKLASIAEFLPQAENLSGELSLNLQAKAGQDFKPSLNGTAKLLAADFTLAEPALSGQNFTGEFTLNDSVVDIISFGGLLNNAPLIADGRFDYTNLENSNLDLAVSDFQYESNDQELYVNTAAVLNVRQNTQGKAQISGDVLLNEVLFRKELTFNKILAQLKKYLSGYRSGKQTKKKRKTKKVSDIGLNITVSANRNIFLLTNLAESEFKASFKLTGSITNPQIKGQLKALYGWFDLNSTRFDLNSATLTFRPYELVPELSFVAETSVINNLGEPTYIIAEANNTSLLAPNVQFSSDQNLTNREILGLLTTGGGLRLRTSANQQFNFYQNSKKDHSGNLFGAIFDDLTRFDSIKIEPAYNYRTGLIEPNFITRKSLDDHFYLTSETFFSGSGNASKVSANYNATPYFTLSAIADTVTTQDNTALELASVFTVLSQRRKNLTINLTGTNDYSLSSVKQTLRINSDSQIMPEDIGYLEKLLAKNLLADGYLAATGKVSCVVTELLCNELTIEVNSGEQFLVTGYSFVEGQQLPEHISLDPLPKDQVASIRFKERLKADLVLALRKEGFIQARPELNYQPTEAAGLSNSAGPADNSVSLLIDLRLGSPVSFFFTGNDLYSAEELLDLIKVFERPQPFGNNTINLLLTLIKQAYLREGYYMPGASARLVQDDPAAGGRKNYLVNIDQGLKVRQINQIFSETEKLVGFKQWLRNRDPLVYEQLYVSQKSLLPVSFEANVELITEFLLAEGYLSPEVSYELAFDPAASMINASYLIAAEQKLTFDAVSLRNYPDDVADNLQLDRQTYSINQVNQLINVALDNLENAGYLQPLAFTEVDKQTVTLVFELAARAKISELKCLNQQPEICSQILKISGLTPSQYYRRKDLNTARSRLLKTGLYQYVDLSLADRQLDAEDEAVTIKVIEKPKQTLDFGLGLNSELGVHIFGEAVDRGIFADGRTLSARADFFYDPGEGEVVQGIAGVRYQNPNLAAGTAKYTFDLGLQKYNNPTLEYNLDRTTAENLLQKTFGNGLASSIGHSLLFDSLDEVSTGAILSDLDFGNLRISMFSGQTTYNFSSVPLRTNSVSNSEQNNLKLLLGLEYKLASEAIASEADFYGLLGRVAFSTPLPVKRLSMANNLALGSINSFGASAAVPITQRYYAGGRNSIRGFRENSLGEQGSDSAVIGGNYTLSNNLELRYLVAKSLSVHTFFDFGNVFLSSEDLRQENFRESAGLGFRYLSPIGPIGFDFGHPLDRQAGEPSLRTHFSVGSVF